MDNIFTNVFFTEMLLPFLLVFVVVFAILRKSKILGGEEAIQIDAIVGLVVGLILIGVPGPRDIIVGLMPWMAVGIAIILVFMILYGFVAGDLSSEKMPKGLRIGFGVLAGIFTVGVVLYVTGWGDLVWDSFEVNSDIWMNVVMIALVLGAVAVAVFGGKGGDKPTKPS